MMTYNNKYRGPFEYDKFILNILPFHNMVEQLESYEFIDASEDICNLITIQAEIDEVYNAICGEDRQSEKIHRMILERKGLI